LIFLEARKKPYTLARLFVNREREGGLLGTRTLMSARPLYFMPAMGYYSPYRGYIWMRTTGRSWLRPFLQPLWPTFREVAVLSLFINLLALAVPVFVMQVYDRVVFHAGLATLEGLVIGIVCVLAFDLSGDTTN
jgi:hypothetical protein